MSRLTTAPKLRVIPDQELDRIEQVECRLRQLRHLPPTPGTTLRIQALTARLPKQPGGPLLPSIDPSLLISKSDETWGQPTNTVKDLWWKRPDDRFKTEVW